MAFPKNFPFRMTANPVRGEAAPGYKAPRPALMLALIHEIAHGDSLRRLYAGLLASAVIDNDPTTRRDWSSELRRLGIPVEQSNQKTFSCDPNRGKRGL